MARGPEGEDALTGCVQVHDIHASVIDGPDKIATGGLESTIWFPQETELPTSNIAVSTTP